MPLLGIPRYFSLVFPGHIGPEFASMQNRSRFDRIRCIKLGHMTIFSAIRHEKPAHIEPQLALMQKRGRFDRVEFCACIESAKRPPSFGIAIPPLLSPMRNLQRLSRSWPTDERATPQDVCSSLHWFSIGLSSWPSMFHFGTYWASPGIY